MSQENHFLLASKCIFRIILTTCSGDIDHFFPMMLTTPF
jgi:hypothetical protein